MRKIILSAIVVLGLAACEGTGDRTYNAPDLDSSTGPITGGDGSSNQTVDDTTPTTNNNLYHTDSASGQGSTYDTSNRNNQSNTNNPGGTSKQGTNNTTQ